MRTVILSLVLILAACGDDKDHPGRDDAGIGDDAGGSGKLVGCLDSPGLEMPPTNGALPCDLVPPGLELTP